MKQEGEQRSRQIEELVREYAGPVYRVCYRFTRNREDAEDLSQEVFIRAGRALPNFREEASLSTWLYRIAVNLSLNHLRSRKKRITASLEALKDTGMESVYPLEEADRRELLMQVIQRLPEKQMSVFILNKQEGMTAGQIAKVLKCSQSSVEVAIHRARLALRKMIVEQYRELLPEK